MVPFKFWTKNCAHAAQIFSHLAHGARILRSRVIILFSAGFQPKDSQQDYPLDWALQHAIKIKRSPSLHSHDQACPVDDGPVEVSNEGLQHALKSLKRSTCIEKSQSSYRIELNKENHLFYGIESWDRQETCSEKKVHAHATWLFKDGQKKFRRVPLFLVLKILQTKYSLHWQSSEFLLTKDREIADNVHQGPLSIDFDDEWIRA